MVTPYTPFDTVRSLFPDEWVLIGDPQMEDTHVLGGSVLFHSKDKKEICYIGRDKTAGYSKVTIVYTGDIRQHRRIGILRRA